MQYLVWESNPSFRAWEALVLTVRPTRLSSRDGIWTHVLRDMSPFWSLSRHPAKSVMGIEPIYLAWKASVITIILHRQNRSREIRTPNVLVPNQADCQIVLYSVIWLKVAVDGLEPTYHTVWRCCVAITLYCNNISVQGLEPWTFWLRISCSTIELHRFIMTNEISPMGLEPTCCFQRTIKSRVPCQLGDGELNVYTLFSTLLFSFLHNNYLLHFFICLCELPCIRYLWHIQ